MATPFGADLPAIEAFEEGKRLAGAGDWEAARTALTSALQLNPHLAGARYLLGCAHLELERPVEALAAFDQSIVACPGVSDFENGRGSALRSLGRVEEALAAFRNALNLSDRNLDAWVNIAEAEYDRGNEAEARAALTKANELAPDDPQVIDLTLRIASSRPHPGDTCSEDGQTPVQASGYYGNARPEVVNFIPADVRRVLDVGCAGGVMGALIKARRGCEVVGIEAVASVAQKASERLDRVVVADLDQTETLPFPKGYFDCITFADVLEHLTDPARALKLLRKYLNESGTIVCSYPNVQNATVLLDLLVNGRWTYRDEGLLDRTHLRFFTLQELQQVMNLRGFEIELLGQTSLNAFDSLDQLVSLVRDLGGDGERFRYQTLAFQYIFRARMKNAPKPTGEGAGRSPSPAARSRLAMLQQIVPGGARNILNIGYDMESARALSIGGMGRTVTCAIARSPTKRSGRQNVASAVFEVNLEGGDEVGLPFGKFDSIVLDDVLPRLRRPEAALRRLQPYLAPGGSVVFSTPNVRHVSVLLNLLVACRWNYRGEGLLDPQHLKFFTGTEIQHMLQDSGFQAQTTTAITSPQSEQAIQRMSELVSLLGGNAEQFRLEAQVQHYLVAAQSVDG